MKRKFKVPIFNFGKKSGRLEAAKILKSGGIGVFPTDTIYGLAGSALSPRTVKRIYKVRRRNSVKPFIILIDSPEKLSEFGIKPDSSTQKILKKIWPGPVSLILPVPYKKFAYLHRGTKTLAFRVPEPKQLRDFLKLSGPLAAPSANPEGLPPAGNIEEAGRYFGREVDFYVRGSISKNARPSKIYMFINGKLEIVRK